MKLHQTQTEFNCGIDLHARSMYICVMDREGNILVHRNVRHNDFNYLLKLVEPYRHDLTVACECTFSCGTGSRWRIEMYFKVLKSGLKVESCRLAHAERLVRYLTVMSIVAWRLFMITLIARTEPTTPCTAFFADQEWQVLFLKTNPNRRLPQTAPTIGEAVVWVAKLGGFLARKGDGLPGTMTLWRGWKRLADLTDGWNLATQRGTYG